ncbi:MAG: ferrochelatase [Mariprofundaceae bacterium]
MPASPENAGKAGVLLVNLGSPEAPTPAAVRRYLAEFFSDPRVVELPRWLWLPILHGVILRIRPRRSAAAYREIWTDEGSPLIAIARRQAEALQARLGAGVPVALAMRYGEPSIRTGLADLRDAGCDRVLVLPMYPQYSATTTASVFDAVAEELKTWRRVPALRFVADYHDHPAYIAALAERIRAFRSGDEGEAPVLLISFHGIPERCVKAGDPYRAQCERTAGLLRAALGVDAARAPLSFQSRFGREPWLAPYTDETLRRLAGDGIEAVDVVCPGFSADCLETLEEIAMQNRDVFLAAGGKRFRYIPALNDSPAHIAALASIIRAELAGWMED